MRKNIYIKIHEFGEKHLDGFALTEIIKELKLVKDWESEIIRENIKNAFYNRQHLGASGFSEKNSIFYCMKLGSNFGLDDNNKFILNTNAYFNYIDYLELKEAQKTAKNAQKSSMKAIKIATFTLIASIIFSIIGILISYFK